MKKKSLTEQAVSIGMECSQSELRSVIETLRVIETKRFGKAIKVAAKVRATKPLEVKQEAV